MAEGTKAALAEALKLLLQRMPITKIRVSDLTARCGINRQTFYYHFHDIYDLLHWTCTTEANQVIEDYRSQGNWQAGFIRFMQYILDNRDFCLNTYRSVDQELLERGLFAFTQHLLDGVMTEVAHGRTVREEDSAFIVQFYSYGFMGVLKEWLSDGARKDPAPLVAQLELILRGTFEEALDKCQRAAAEADRME